MSKRLIFPLAAAAIVLAAIVMAGAGVAQASSTVHVNFNGLPTETSCTKGFNGTGLSANSKYGSSFVWASSNAGGNVPECLIEEDTFSVTVDHGMATGISFKYDAEGFGISFYRNGMKVGSDSKSGVGVYNHTVDGGFDKVVIEALGYFDDFAFTFGSPASTPGQVCPDDRINCHLYDDQIVLYGANDGTAIDVFMVDGSSQGQYLFTINAADFGDYLNNPPAQDMLIDHVGNVSVYVLSTGEVQVNYGPDANGKTYVIIMEGINGSNPHGYTIP
jgi:hypothetical protein